MPSKRNPHSAVVHDIPPKKQKEGKNRETGIVIVGAVPWGTHLCQFYKTKDDLIDILVPYFKAGLQNNEFCMWIASEPLHADEAKKALKKEVKNLDDYIKKGQIEIHESTDWYTKSGKFDADKVLTGWVIKENWAREHGYDGLRLTGNTFWLEKKDWEDFTNYEEVVNHVIGNYKMIAICSYSLDKCNASEVIDVVSNHQFTLIKREGTWHRIESPEKKNAEAALNESRSLLETVFSSMNEAVVVLNKTGDIIDFNEAFAFFCRFKNKEECRRSISEFAKIIKSYSLDGKLQPVEEWPAVRALKGETGYNQEFLIKRTDLGVTWIASTSFAPLRNKNSEILGVVQTFQDITEHKKSEMEKEHQTQLLDQVQDGIIRADLDFRITYWNPGAEQMYGYSKAEALGKTTIELLRPTYFPGEREKIIDELHRIGTSKGRIRTRHRNGTEIIVDVNSTQITDKNGNITGYVVTYRDVTDHERAQTALREAESKYRTVADNTYDFEFWIDSKGRYLYASPSCERITGHTKDEFVNDPFLREQLVHPDDKQSFLDHVSYEHLKKKPGELEFRIIHKDGSVRWIHHVCQPLLDKKGKFLGVRGSNRDIAERKRIEEALTKQHEELQTILDTVPASVFYKDTENRLLRVNKSFTEMMELPKGELENKSLFDLYPKEQAEAFWNDDLEVITTGKPKINIIEPVKSKKGLLWMQTHKIPYRDQQGNIIGVLGFALDITERKQAEDAFKQSELRYRRLFESAKDGILLIDFNTGMIEDVNPFLINLLGYSKNEFLKKHLWEISVFKDIVPSKNNFLKLQKKQYIRYEDLPIQTKDGKKVDVEFVSNVYEVDSRKTIQCNIRNITDRKKAEEELRETHNYLENLLNYANAPIIVWDKDFKIIRFNHAFEHLTGYTSKMIIGKKLDHLFPNESKKESLQKIQRTLGGEFWDSVEIPILRKDKNIRIALWNSANIYDNSGKNLIATIAQGTDITERKKAEDAVLQAKLEWERTFNSVPDLIAILDKSHRIIQVNKTMAQRLGIPADQCINLNCHMCVHGATKPPAFCPHTLTLKDGKEHVAEVYEDKLGGYFLVSTTPIFDNKGTLLGAVHVARDITERKQVEEALKESEKRLNRAQELAHLGSWELDLINNHITWSNEVYWIFGLQPQEFEATYEAFLQSVHPEDRAAVDAAYSESLREGRDTYEIEHRVVRKNGDVRVVYEKCEHIRDKFGKVVRSIGMVHDITERKQMETELQRIEWLLTKHAKSESQHDETGKIIPTQPYGDLTVNNRSRLIRDSLGPELLADIVADYLDLLETSAAVYEKNGDYAIGIFTSGWCKFMDLTSRHRCGTADNQKALNSGKWLCHESCWTNASKNTIKTGQPADIECEGGIHIYAVPIMAGKEIVGSINFGYGDPPRSSDKLNELAGKYNVNVEELRRHAEAYQTRPLYIIELAKSRLEASARLIGEIVERKQAESELVRLASFPLKNPNPIIEVDLSGTIQYLNPVTQQLFPDLEKKGLNHQLLKGIKKLMPEIQKKKTLAQETNVNDKWFLLTISFIPENRRIRIYGTDITLRKKAEEVLQVSEEKYRSIVENTTNVIMVTQPNGIISYLSPACKDVLGHDPNELVGTNPTIYHPDDAETVQQSFVRALKGVEGSNLQYRIITKEGKIKWISHSWTSIIKGREVKSIVSVIEDITQRKIAEENIKKLNENLFHHSLELATANRELEAFSYSVSHDLRAPLRSIDGFGQAILEDYADKLDEQGKDYIQRVRTATQRMGQLIDDLLRLSRLSRAELHVEQINLSSLARTTAEKLQATDPSRKVKITIQDQINTSGDKKLLEILFENLLGNAWKFTGNNKHPTIKFGETIKDDERVYYIQDNGAGFDMAYTDKLFIPFQRLHSVDEFPGTGIGLAIVSRIVHRHGGRIWAEGEVGKGATFYFTLQEKMEK